MVTKKSKAAKNKAKEVSKEDDTLTVKELGVLAAKTGMTMEALVDLMDAGGLYLRQPQTRLVCGIRWWSNSLNPIKSQGKALGRISRRRLR